MLTADAFCGIDDYNYIYSFKNSSIIKSGTSDTYRFSDLTLGNPTSLDILNPLKLVAFYEMTQTVIILDNKLSEITRVNFNNLEEPILATHARQAGDRKLWLFNADTQAVLIFDYQRNATVINFQPEMKSIIGMASDFNNCWTTNDTTLTHYNNYGIILEKHPIADVQHIQSSDEKLILYSGEKWLFMDAENKTFVPIDLPVIDVQSFSFIGDTLHIYDGKQLSTFKITRTN